MQDRHETRFAAVMEAEGPALRRLALAYAGDAADAEDLLQEIWLAIWRALPSFRGDCSERTFVFRIGHNRGLTFRARRRPPPADLDAVPLADPGPAPDAVAEGAAASRQLMALVRALPPALREVAVLRLEGLDNREIAEVTGLTENNVAVRLSRARARLRQALNRAEATA